MINPIKQLKEYYEYRKTLKEIEFVNREDILRYIDGELEMLDCVIDHCHKGNLGDYTTRYFEGQRSSLAVLKIRIKGAKLH